MVMRINIDNHSDLPGLPANCKLRSWLSGNVSADHFAGTRMNQAETNE